MTAVFSVVVVLAVAVFLLATALTWLNAKLLRSHGDVWRVPGGRPVRSSSRDAQIEGCVAMAMCVERAENRPEPVRLLCYL